MKHCTAILMKVLFCSFTFTGKYLISHRTAFEIMGDYEKFADDPEADELLTRVYRKPYVVPESV